MRMSINGADIFFDVAGSSLAETNDGLLPRPTIVALHGGPGFDHGYLRPGLEPLSRDAQIIYVDLRGQGRSTTPDVTTCTLEQMADDVAALIEQLGIERPILFGHSAGGFVALHLAVRHPRVPGGLILCNTTPTLGPLPGTPPALDLAERADAEALAAAARMFSGDTSPEAIDDFGRLVLPFYAGPERMDVPPRLWKLTTFEPEIGSFFFSTQAMRYDLSAKLRTIRVPALVVTGSYDWVVAPAGSDVLAAELPDAELVVLRESGHFSFAEEPEAFQSAVRAYLERLEALATYRHVS